MMKRVAQYTELESTGQRVCNHAAQIIALHVAITNKKTQALLLPECDDTGMEDHIPILTIELGEARMKPSAAGTEKELRDELAVMTRDAQHSGEEV